MKSMKNTRTMPYFRYFDGFMTFILSPIVENKY